MVAAYATARAAASGHLVLYHVGKFYEVLGDDAATVSRLLGIQLTRRRQAAPCYFAAYSGDVG